jgi:hypothetical protein
MASSFVDVLHSRGPAPDRADKMALYGRFVGDWEADLIAYEPDGTRHAGRAEIHFGWVLEGRAIQDVWMVPPLAERTADTPAMPVAGNWYGTTLRVYDPELDAWHIFWNDPVMQQFTRQLGRAVGADIVQEGQDGAVMRRWSFTEIKADSFHWKGEVSSDGGVTWGLQIEVFARRVGGPGFQ